ncbi:hypothetical protein ACXIHB_10805 [Tenacibaculum sp. IMCC1]|uniref:Uncharacterized protein n=1 Tax=Tenacibaculum sp. Pbs-1 TaxID=3238748 RepID=A0AB33L503_9FLAO
MVKNEDGLYSFLYDGKIIGENLTEKQAEEFLKELFTKTKDKSGDIVKKYLDELKVRLRKIKKYNFKSQSIRKKYLGEESTDIVERWSWPYSVKYLDDIERIEYKVLIKEGKLYNQKGQLIDTLEAGTLSFNSQKAIFVMDRDGTIYLSNFYEPKYFHHSSFLAGKPVCAAGEIKVIAGEIKEVNISSGHYEPTYKLNMQFIELLEKEYNIKINLKDEY